MAAVAGRLKPLVALRCFLLAGLLATSTAIFSPGVSVDGSLELQEDTRLVEASEAEIASGQGSAKAAEEEHAEDSEDEDELALDDNAGEQEKPKHAHGKGWAKRARKVKAAPQQGWVQRAATHKAREARKAEAVHKFAAANTTFPNHTNQVARTAPLSSKAVLGPRRTTLEAQGHRAGNSTVKSAGLNNSVCSGRNESGQCSLADCSRMYQMGGGKRAGSFPAVSAECGKSAFNLWGFKLDEGDFEKCMGEKIGISGECMACFTGAAKFALKKCMGPCMDWKSEDCLNCQDQYGEILTSCVGFLPPPALNASNVEVGKRANTSARNSTVTSQGENSTKDLTPKSPRSSATAGDTAPCEGADGSGHCSFFDCGLMYEMGGGTVKGSFPQVASECALDNFDLVHFGLNKTAFAGCMTNKTGLSADCIGCFEVAADVVTEYCWMCFDWSSDACTLCQEQHHVTETTTRCAGFLPPQVQVSA